MRTGRAQERPRGAARSARPGPCPPARPGLRAGTPAAVLAVAGLALSLVSPTHAAEASFLIVNPAGRGDQGLASSFLADFGSALAAAWPEAAGPAPDFSGNYHVNTPDALASVRGRRPLIALVSTGFYLEHAAELGLIPLARPLLEGEGDGNLVVRLIVRAGTDAVAASRIEQGSLGGLRLGGQLAGEPRYLLEHVLAGAFTQGDGPGPVLVPLSRTLDVIRRLRAGELDAAVLGSPDWGRLQAAHRTEGLEVAWTSARLAGGPVVAVGSPGGQLPPGDAAVRRALAALAVHALLAFDATASGRQVLGEMGLRSFVPASAADYPEPATLTRSPTRQP